MSTVQARPSQLPSKHLEVLYYPDVAVGFSEGASAVSADLLLVAEEAAVGRMGSSSVGTQFFFLKKKKRKKNPRRDPLRSIRASDPQQEQAAEERETSTEPMKCEFATDVMPLGKSAARRKLLRRKLPHRSEYRLQAEKSLLSFQEGFS